MDCFQVVYGNLQCVLQTDHSVGGHAKEWEGGLYISGSGMDVKWGCAKVKDHRARSPFMPIDGSRDEDGMGMPPWFGGGGEARLPTPR